MKPGRRAQPPFCVRSCERVVAPGAGLPVRPRKWTVRSPRPRRTQLSWPLRTPSAPRGRARGRSPRPRRRRPTSIAPGASSTPDRRAAHCRLCARGPRGCAPCSRCSAALARHRRTACCPSSSARRREARRIARRAAAAGAIAGACVRAVGRARRRRRGRRTRAARPRRTTRRPQRPPRGASLAARRRSHGDARRRHDRASARCSSRWRPRACRARSRSRVVGSLAGRARRRPLRPEGHLHGRARQGDAARVVAYEIASSPVDVWQAPRGRAGRRHDHASSRASLELSSERVRIRKSVLVGAATCARRSPTRGWCPSTTCSRCSTTRSRGTPSSSDIRPGARLRIVATLERVDGAFVRWASLDAVEYFPASASAPARARVLVRRRRGPPTRPPRLVRRQGPAALRTAAGASPVPLARVASRFNPHRMHPVLHVVMPHNGVDLRASAGAPVYATAAGTVTSVGNDGPCGNKVEIAHPGGITSVYCHLSRFAAGLHVGQHVEGRQLIAYVGQTGRVTGPHLHFGIKKNGVVHRPDDAPARRRARGPARARRDEFDRVTRRARRGARHRSRCPRRRAPARPQREGRGGDRRRSTRSPEAASPSSLTCAGFR